ncbi:DEKNAAC101064 [Brettanomyces naardenensis]|uniref:DEKNAAC101064 n=1 Tax=Brettanomyces naardenensis TaxID=13370 RepID=A0A448YGV3_BRENA|nr:DEKNAAC101064 [Brettanomyces naardenensis]
MVDQELLDGWFDPLPLEEYQKLVESPAPSKASGCPEDSIVGSPPVTVACGPNVRFLGCLEQGEDNYRGTILLVTRNQAGKETPKPLITYFIGPAAPIPDTKLELVGDEMEGRLIYQESNYSFFRYDIHLHLTAYEQKVKYGINGEFRKDYQFFIPSVDQSMNIMSFSCNGFSLEADVSSFKGSLWLDVLRRHEDFHYHVMLGGGDQIYCDSITTASKQFARWLKHKHTHSRWKLTPEIKASLEAYYLNHYVEWFGKGYAEITKGPYSHALFPVALHQIPQINIYDDHDIIDGFGSYSDITMSQDIFMGVGNAAFKYYMLFQHHTFPGESLSLEKSWITGSTKGPYIHEVSRSIYARLGKDIAFLGLDCRTERTKKQICSPDTYDRVFNRLQAEITASNEQIKHFLVLLGVPICYPRMVWIETIMESPLIFPIKWLARKGVIFKGLVNEFDGSIELLDDLNDHWCARHHKAERNRLMARLLTFGASNGVRITILSGDVHLCCMSRFRSKFHRHHLIETSRLKEENVNVALHASKDPRLIVNLISSAIVNTPPPNGMATLLKKRSKIHKYDMDTDEDMIPLFTENTDKTKRNNDLILNQRNFSDLILVKNLSQKQRKPYEKFKEGDLIYPGPVDNMKVAGKVDPDDPEHIGYPLEEDSLVATLHVEVKREDVKSETRGYQMLVPKLEGKYRLEDVGRKF